MPKISQNFENGHFSRFFKISKNMCFLPMFYTQIPNFEVLRSKTAILEPKTYFSGIFRIFSDQQFWEILAIWIQTLSSFYIRFTSIMAQNDQKGGTRITFSVNIRFFRVSIKSIKAILGDLHTVFQKFPFLTLRRNFQVLNNINLLLLPYTDSVFISEYNGG